MWAAIKRLATACKSLGATETVAISAEPVPNPPVPPALVPTSRIVAFGPAAVAIAASDLAACANYGAVLAAARSLSLTFRLTSTSVVVAVAVA